jgi:hypothetical protein
MVGSDFGEVKKLNFFSHVDVGVSITLSDTIGQHGEPENHLKDAIWRRQNWPVDPRHPLSSFVYFAGEWSNLPADALQ